MDFTIKRLSRNFNSFSNARYDISNVLKLDFFFKLFLVELLANALKNCWAVCKMPLKNTFGEFPFRSFSYSIQIYDDDIKKNNKGILRDFNF